MDVSTGIVNRAELTKGVKDAISSLDRQEVERVAYNIGNDSTDDPSIFFRIVLTERPAAWSAWAMLSLV